MACDGYDDPCDTDREIERLRREVRSLRHEIAGRGAMPAARPARGVVMAGAIGACALGGIVLAAAVAVDLPAAVSWATMSDLVPTRAAVGIVERIFTVY
ncbi:MAG TPA: hypothetical protein VF649_06400 [Sphingomonas sp.]|jgi:hypothetical protein|uniref:hypothetical protein n=1 Tax=Sphingomonas sp. TaxID=28214 RepID=UPI002EDB10A8